MASVASRSRGDEESRFTQIHSYPGRPPKRRAAQACLQCRSRKVRCDLMQSEGTCTNCRLDGVACEVVDCKRRKKKLLHNNGRNDGSNVTVENRPIISNLQPRNEISDILLPQNEVDLPTLSNARESSLDPIDPSLLETDSASKVTDSQYDPYIRLPTFIKPLSSDLQQEDLQYLELKGVFDLPPPKLRSMIICRYAEFVDPLYPVFDLAEFLQIINGESDKKISLLLYHAVMCAGLAAVESHHTIDAGYASKIAARSEYYTKAKILFDLDTESDRIVICQAAILLIGWAKGKHYKDATHWTGIAISQAYCLKLHREDTAIPKTRREKRLRRRLWWVVLIRECDVCLTMGRPPRATPRGTPLLEMDDFADVMQSIRLNNSFDHTVYIRDEDMQRRHAAAYIERANLAIRIFQAMQISPCNMSSPLGQASSPETASLRIFRAGEDLENWRLNLPYELQWSKNAILRADPAERGLHLQLSVMYLTYWLTINSLHKPEIFSAGWPQSPSENGSSDEKVMNGGTHVREMRRAANEMTTIHKTLDNLGLNEFVPALGVASACAAVFVHLLDASSKHISLRVASLENLRLCVNILKTLGEINYTAKDVAKLVEVAADAAASSSNHTAKYTTPALQQTRDSDPMINGGRASPMNPFQSLPIWPDEPNGTNMPGSRSSVNPIPFGADTPSSFGGGELLFDFGLDDLIMSEVV